MMTVHKYFWIAKSCFLSVSASQFCSMAMGIGTAQVAGDDELDLDFMDDDFQQQVLPDLAKGKAKVKGKAKAKGKRQAQDEVVVCFVFLVRI